MTIAIETTAATFAAERGVVMSVPPNKLKKSPRNARKTPHGEAHIEALAASIGAKGMLQNLVVDAEGQTTGFISSPSVKAADWRIALGSR